MHFLIWTLTATLMLTGLAGTLLPLLPGTLLILVAAILHKLLLPAALSWTIVGLLAALWLVSVALDVLGTVATTRWFGGSKWGMAGAGGGALVGMFISLPALILGSVLGAVAAEKFGAKRDNDAALRAGVGAGLGFVVSTVARLACALAMIGVFLFAAWPR